MSYGPYPQYKDSEVEWLGEVPEHWEVSVIKRWYQVVLGKMLQPEKKSQTDELMPYLRAANIQINGVDTHDVRNMWFSPSDMKRLLLQSGDLLVSEGGDVGRAAIWEKEETMFFQNAINRVRSEKGHSNKFLYYWINTVKTAGFIDIICNKATIAHYTAEKLGDTPTLNPPVKEQAQIARFLDHETGKIDGLIAEQEKLIELLKEKRQATISHAVTKGLNPDAPMKDSGVEWLGKVPEHWKNRKISHAYNYIGGGTTPPSSETKWYEDGTIPWVTTGELRENTIFETRKMVTEEAVREISSLRVHPQGSLLIALYGATIGRMGFLGVDATCNQACCVLGEPTTLHNQFSFYWLSGFKEQIIELYSTGGGQPNISQEVVLSLRIPAPSLDEQQKISDFLDVETAKLDTLLSEAGQGIELLKERRSALISAAVTGKIDVRSWKPQGDAA